MPNKQTIISSEEIEAAKANKFITMNDRDQTLIFGPRAASLLRSLDPIVPHGTPGLAEPRHPPAPLRPAPEGVRSTMEDTNPNVPQRTMALLRDVRKEPSPYPGFVSFLGDMTRGMRHGKLWGSIKAAAANTFE